MRLIFFRNRNSILLWAIPFLIIGVGAFITLCYIGLAFDTGIIFPRIFSPKGTNIYEVFVNIIFGILLFFTSIAFIWISLNKMSKTYNWS